MLNQLMVFAALGISALAGFFFAAPSPVPDLWPVAIGMIALALCGFITSLIWSYAWIKYIHARYPQKEEE